MVTKSLKTGIIILLLPCFQIFSDPLIDPGDWNFLMRNTKSPEHHRQKTDKRIRLSWENEFKLTLDVLLLFYQNIISTQDQPSCNFTPTCSQYAKEAIQKHGPLGIFIAADRLHRCNGMGKGYYPIDPETGKLYDPLD
jgi:hypothetical protein